MLNGEWKRHGKWMLPFIGCAHFDCVLAGFPENRPPLFS
jgi:hypothetical protein